MILYDDVLEIQTQLNNCECSINELRSKEQLSQNDKTVITQLDDFLREMQFKIQKTMSVYETKVNISAEKSKFFSKIRQNICRKKLTILQYCENDRERLTSIVKTELM